MESDVAQIILDSFKIKSQSQMKTFSRSYVDGTLMAQVLAR